MEFSRITSAGTVTLHPMKIHNKVNRIRNILYRTIKLSTHKPYLILADIDYLSFEVIFVIVTNTNFV